MGAAEKLQQADTREAANDAQFSRDWHLFQKGFDELQRAAENEPEAVSWYQKEQQKFLQKGDIGGWNEFVEKWININKKQKESRETLGRQSQLTNKQLKAVHQFIFEQANSSDTKKVDVAMETTSKDIENLVSTLNLVQGEQYSKWYIQHVIDQFLQTEGKDTAKTNIEIWRQIDGRRNNVLSKIAERELPNAEKKKLAATLDGIVNQDNAFGNEAKVMAEMDIFLITRVENSSELKQEALLQKSDELLQLAKHQPRTARYHTHEAARRLCLKITDKKLQKQRLEQIDQLQSNNLEKTLQKMQQRCDEVKGEAQVESDGEVTYKGGMGWSEGLVVFRDLLAHLGRLPGRVKSLQSGAVARMETELRENIRVSEEGVKKEKLEATDEYKEENMMGSLDDAGKIMLVEAVSMAAVANQDTGADRMQGETRSELQEKVFQEEVKASEEQKKEQQEKQKEEELLQKQTQQRKEEEMERQQKLQEQGAVEMQQNETLQQKPLEQEQQNISQAADIEGTPSSASEEFPQKQETSEVSSQRDSFGSFVDTIPQQKTETTPSFDEAANDEFYKASPASEIVENVQEKEYSNVISLSNFREDAEKANATSTINRLRDSVASGEAVTAQRDSGNVVSFEEARNRFSKDISQHIGKDGDANAVTRIMDRSRNRGGAAKRTIDEIKAA